MEIERPGRPENLPAAELLWARWALAAVLEATGQAERTPRVHRTGTWIDGEGLHLDDCGCTWWTLAPMGRGRYVLYGEDESSGVKWHEPAIDMLAQAPDWLPFDRLRGLLEGWELGCVYWYEDGAWARAPYPEGLEDDGLDCGMSRFAVREEVLGLLVDSDRGLPPGRAAELLAAAEAYRLGAPEIETALAEADGHAGEHAPEDRRAALRALEHAGLSAPR
ncbi:hypothetical protein ACIRBY_04690 [Streptomyces sp. NPDC096136]|uniref:hypothetical protein n=1 Tax=Streptomyces sp. NPDC096136 TaxID=3366076 RepID=UPI0037F3DF5E